jgi:DNA polymerase III sliding clamp (beta) subunit (PCNA family)
MLVGAARLLDGEFPDYHQAVPTKQAIKIEIPDPVAWIGILEQAGRVASERTQGVKLSITRQGVTCQAENPDTGRYKAELPVSPVTCALKAPELMVGFNAQYLREGLAYLKDGGPVSLSLDDDLSPGVFAQGDRTVVVMPMRI